jgi:hypothetical protein
MDALELAASVVVEQHGAGRVMELQRQLECLQLHQLFSRNADSMIIGRFWAPAHLAFTAAYRVMLFPLQTMTPGRVPCSRTKPQAG